MRTSLIRDVTYEIDKDSNFRDLRQVTCECICLILENHQPEPLGKAKHDKLTRILAAANREIGGKNE